MDRSQESGAWSLEAVGSRRLALARRKPRLPICNLQSPRGNPSPPPLFPSAPSSCLPRRVAVVYDVERPETTGIYVVFGSIAMRPL